MSNTNKTKTRKWISMAKRNQASACGIPLPAIVIRLVPIRQKLDEATIDAPLMLYPHRPLKMWMGKDPLAKILQSMMNLLGVYALAAVRILEADPITSDPKGSVEKICARSLKYLLEIGRSRLAIDTGLDDNEHLMAWAANPTSIFRVPTSTIMVSEIANLKRQIPFREAVLDPVRLLSTAIARTERILGAFQSTQLAPDEKVEAAVVEAFRANSQFGAWDCYQVAMFADISPGPLWRAQADYTPIFELGRFVGRIDRGAMALLTSYHFQSMEQVLVRGRVKDVEFSKMNDNVVSAIDMHFGVERFRKMIQRAATTGGVIAVERQTRRLRCRRDVGPMTRLRGRP